MIEIGNASFQQRIGVERSSSAQNYSCAILAMSLDDVESDNDCSVGTNCNQMLLAFVQAEKNQVSEVSQVSQVFGKAGNL